MGAPVRYTDEERKTIKKIENDYYYGLKRKNLIEEVEKSNAEIKEDFIKGLSTLAVCDFTHLLTLTIDPKRIGKNNLLKQLHDDEIRPLLTHFPDMEKYLIENKPYSKSIDFVQNIGTAYFNHLFAEKIISNALTALEKDKMGRWHIHALISSNHINVTSLVQSKWFYGNADIAIIGEGKYDNGDTLEQHRERIIDYMYQTFNPTSTSNIQQKRLDYWYLYHYEVPVSVSTPPTTTPAQLVDEIKLLNNHFSGGVTLDEYSREQGSIKDFLMNNGQSLLQFLKVPPVALFYLLTIILMLI